MTVGTKSILFGIHQFLLHPFLVAMAWNRLYGFPNSFRLWCCFFLHDIGYIGKTDMDSEEIGQTHPELGARVITKLFGKDWGDFSLYHSRFYCRTNNQRHSKLCTADKLAFCMYPPKLYCFLARLSGEMAFYKEFSEDVNEFEDAHSMSDMEWYHALKRYTLRVVTDTNRTYFDHVEIGKKHHPREYISGRIKVASIRGKDRGDYRTCDDSVREHARSRRIAREQLKLSGQLS
jgi:hypothetical protein